MSGGRWGYSEHRINDLAAEYREGSEVYVLLRAVAKCEHLIDWTESGDSAGRAWAESRVYDVLKDAFCELWDQ